MADLKAFAEQLVNLTVKEDTKLYRAITDIQVTKSGSEYVDPQIVIPDETGNGTGATAEAVVEDGKIVQINITNGGSNYTNNPPINIVDVAKTSGDDAKVSFTVRTEKTREIIVKEDLGLFFADQKFVVTQVKNDGTDFDTTKIPNNTKT